MSTTSHTLECPCADCKRERKAYALAANRTAQRPHVRAHNVCVACNKDDKPVGLLLHWECHDAQKARHDGDYSPRVNKMLDMLERVLARSTSHMRGGRAAICEGQS